MVKRELKRECQELWTKEEKKDKGPMKYVLNLRIMVYLIAMIEEVK